MAARPEDPRPRSSGHVLLAIPGTRLEDKGYLEPGGSFSPGFGSFGIAIWMFDDQGKLTTTSDALDLSEIDQQLAPPDGGLPAIHTKTKHYEATWTALAVGQFELRLRPAQAPGRIALAVRSVGPAGGAIQTIAATTNGVVLDGRWRLEATAPPQIVRLGEEPASGSADFHRLVARTTEAKSATGWSYALLAWPDEDSVRLLVTDTRPTVPSPLTSHAITDPLQLDLPDRRFSDSVHAQVAHMLMSLVGKETRPGEPANYPLEWLRDGAYVIVGLVRAGRVDAARELLDSFFEQDYFGGFGAEGDAPGFALWAISEVLRADPDPQLADTAYPHVYRKAELIGQLMTATRDVIHEPVGNIVPVRRHRVDVNLVAEPAKDGLINGRMDWGRPSLYMNAVSYMGLRRAVELASARGDSSAAQRWQRWADKLREAWQREYPALVWTNERVFISGMHPSFIAHDSPQYAKDVLHEGWDNFLRVPQDWTYFTAARGHQLLLLGRVEQAWTVLEDFLDNQSSPGLYTWREGTGEENTFDRWENVRGWMEPKAVTPHYWTAAEVLLMQLSMLAYADESATDAGFVIGAGIPAEWLKQPFSASHLQTARGRVDLSWDLSVLTAKIYAPAAPVRAGAAFPTGSLRAEFVTTASAPEPPADLAPLPTLP